MPIVTNASPPFVSGNHSASVSILTFLITLLLRPPVSPMLLKPIPTLSPHFLNHHRCFTLLITFSPLNTCLAGSLGHTPTGLWHIPTAPLSTRLGPFPHLSALDNHLLLPPSFGHPASGFECLLWGITLYLYLWSRPLF